MTRLAGIHPTQEAAVPALVNLGLDTSGRTIYLTPRMRAAFDLVCDRAGVTPVIVQGAFMGLAGGGAADSAGYHDGAGCIDTRVWNLTVAEQEAVIREARKVGWAVWLRDHRHGMDPHMHWLLLDEPDMAAGAAWQEAEYRAGRDGLATRGPDYHWRPKTIPTYNHQSEEDDMPYTDWPQKDRDALARDIANANWQRKLPMGKGEDPIPAQALLRQARNQAAAAKVDPTALAAAVVAALPSGSVSEATVVAGVKKALVELVNQED